MRIDPEFYFNLKYDTEGRITEQFSEINTVMELTNGLLFFGGYLPVNNEKYNGMFHKNVNRWHFGFEANNFSKALTGGMFYDWGKYIVRFVNPSYVGYGHNFDVYATIKPFERLRNDLNYSYSDLSKSAGG